MHVLVCVCCDADCMQFLSQHLWLIPLEHLNHMPWFFLVTDLIDQVIRALCYIFTMSRCDLQHIADTCKSLLCVTASLSTGIGSCDFQLGCWLALFLLQNSPIESWTFACHVSDPVNYKFKLNLSHLIHTHLIALSSWCGYFSHC